ncbi:MAG: PH domain-containing protein [Candidatus Hadarchaeales archaeon]
MPMKEFRPHPNLKKVYFIYLALSSIIPLLITVFIPLLAWIYAPAVFSGAWFLLLIPLEIVVLIMAFVAWWIGKYCSSITYSLTDDEVVVEKGVWWRMKHVVPYSRVMSIDVVQGPISRHFGIGRVDIYTAGYTGVVGGTGGPMSRRAEASIWGIPNFIEVRNEILKRVRGRPLFGGGGEIAEEMLEELRSIRELLKKR